MAHSVNDYPGNGWKYTSSNLTRTFLQAPNNWPNAYNARTSDAMATWTNLSGSQLSQILSGDASSDSWSCASSSHNLVTTASIAGSTIAQTTTCIAQNSPVRIRLDTNETWYTAASTPNPANQRDLQAVMTHELGHAHQAWLVCTDGGTSDPCEGKHFDPTNNGAICDAQDLPNFHTMCGGASGNPPLGGSEQWRARSIETHDRDLVEAMY